jgi:hypothetical protein
MSRNWDPEERAGHGTGRTRVRCKPRRVGAVLPNAAACLCPESQPARACFPSPMHVFSPTNIPHAAFARRLACLSRYPPPCATLPPSLAASQNRHGTGRVTGAALVWSCGEHDTYDLIRSCSTSIRGRGCNGIGAPGRARRGRRLAFHSTSTSLFHDFHFDLRDRR